MLSVIGGKICHNLNLGLATKARACKGVSQEGSPWVTFHALGSVGECEGMNSHTPKWAPTLRVGVPMESQIFRDRLQMSNPLDWRILYIIENLLDCRCLKWAYMTHLDTYNTSYDQKKGRESNCQFDSRPLKVKNRPNFLACRWRATYCWKAFNEGYNFSWDLISIEGLHIKLWPPKVAGVPTLGISGLPLGNPRTKMTFGCWSLGQAQSIL
jgi:hypothetical protein